MLYARSSWECRLGLLHCKESLQCISGAKKFGAQDYITGFCTLDMHGDSIKSQPNCLCHIYLIPDRNILKLLRHLDNSTNNKIPTHRNIVFNRLKDMNVWTLGPICQIFNLQNNRYSSDPEPPANPTHGAWNRLHHILVSGRLAIASRSTLCNRQISRKKK